MSTRDIVVGVDIGGTCTDCVVVDATGAPTLAKAFSTPPDFSEGILEVLSLAASSSGTTLEDLLARIRLFLHSTTVAENAVVDGTLARAGLVTTRGFEDTLFATRGGYGRWSGLTEDEKRNPIDTDKLPPIVPRSLIKGVRERTDSRGTVLVPADEADIEEAVAELVQAGVEALGVCLLWSFANPDAERAVAAAATRLTPKTFITLSHEIAPFVGEYERTATVVLNASLGPVIGKYLENLERKLSAHGFEGTLLVMQAHGGLLPVAEAVQRPVSMIESGPVSGVVGSRDLGERIGTRDIIAADMGGTTFKVGVVRGGRIEYQRESMVLRYHYALPKLDVVSLGLAGGSTVSIDERTGTPHIGPGSAGSFPGPACYGHGGEEPTVTDLNAVLGYLDPDFFLGGRTTLDLARARELVEEKVAKPLGRPLIEAAAAMYRLTNSLIHDLLHRTTVQRGLDPRRFSLFSFGGTAGMHVSAYGTQLGVEQIVVPQSASVHGAYGLITSDVAHEDQITSPHHVPVDPAAVAAIFTRLESRVAGQLRREGFGPDEISLSRSIDMRYRRQFHILTVPMIDSEAPVSERTLEETITLFERLYEERYGQESAFREAGIELVSFRLRGTGRVMKEELRPLPTVSEDSSAALVKHVEAWVDRRSALETIPGYSFELLQPGNVVDGPAIVWTPITTLVVAPQQRAALDEFRNIIVRAA